MLSQVLVATDSKHIAKLCKQRRIPFLMTSPAIRTGSDRVAAVLAQLPRKEQETYFLVNIQGDEPVVDPGDIDLVAGEVLAGAAVVVGVRDDLTEADAAKGNITKAAVSCTGRLLLMYRDGPDNCPGVVMRGTGLYAFREQALRDFAGWEQMPLELRTGVEVVRFLEHDYVVRTVKLKGDTIAVDVPQDISRVEEYLARHKSKLS